MLKDFVIGTFTNFFHPSILKALRTSEALANPTPTCPFSSPIKTMEQQLNFLPPFVTFDTLLILINHLTNFVSLSSRVFFCLPVLNWKS